jgi:hypothetical protein
MSAKAAWGLVLIVASVWPAAAQTRPSIPPNEMAGRERERFIDPYPSRERVDPFVAWPKDARSGPRRKCRAVRGARPRKVC